MLNAEKIEKRRKQFTRLFKKSYPIYEQDAEEFASYCVEQWIRKFDTNWRRAFSQLAVDFIRQRTNFSRTHRISHSPDAFDEYEEESIYDHDQGSLSPERFFEKKERALVLRDSELEGRERCILILFYEYGFTGHEIADCFGLTESRVCQILASAQSFLQEKVKNISPRPEQKKREQIEIEILPVIQPVSLLKSQFKTEFFKAESEALHRMERKQIAEILKLQRP